LASLADELKSLIGQDVVLDTHTSFVYIGKLESIGDHFLTLTDVDVFDSSETKTRKEVYVYETRKYGIKRNRSRCSVKIAEVVSLSRLEDVVEF
jgi:small nuclear ribonucleoprotein (snRNP)-like protein